MKLQTKLMVYFIILMFIGIFCSSYMAYLSIYKSMTKHADEVMLITTKAVKNNKNQVIANIKTSLNILAGLKQVRAIIATENPSEESKHIVEEILTSNLKNLLGAKDISLLNSKGMAIISSSPEAVGINYSDRRYIDETFRTGGSLDGPYISKADGKYILTVTEIIESENGKAGILVSSIEIPKLSALTFNNIVVGQREWAFVANSEGKVINSLNDKVEGDVEFIGLDNLTGESGKLKVIVNDEHALVYYEHINKDWYALTALSEDVIISNATTIRNQVLFVSLLVFLFITGILYYFVKKTINSLEGALQRESLLLKTIMNSIPDPLFYKDLNGIYQGCNTAFALFVGKDEKYIIGKTDFEIFNMEKDMAEEFIKHDRIAIERGNVSVNEEWVTYPDFSEHLMETMKTPYGTDDGKAHGLLGISRDITIRYNQERVIEKSKIVAIEANKAKSEFLARMSHEIRTPLNGIIGMNELALQATSNDEIKNFLSKIGISANNLLTIVNDILDFSKIEAGKMVIEQTQFNLQDVLNSIKDIVEPKIIAKNIEFISAIDKNVPKTLIGDPLRLTQVLLNLLSNAVKFTDQGTIALHISVDSDELDKVLLRFEVKDSGIGMTNEQVSRLFSSFSQADGSTSRKYGGTGLGLSISKLLVELMGGKIEAASVFNEGSVFTFIITLLKATDDIKTLNTECNKDEPFNDEKILAGKKVLLAEDNLINQEIAFLLLKKLGIEVDTVKDGLQAVDAVNNKKYDLVLMDIQMPNLDGYEATKRIRANGHKLPIIAITANAMQEDKEKAHKAGMNDHLSKPFKMIDFKTILISWISKEC